MNKRLLLVICLVLLCGLLFATYAYTNKAEPPIENAGMALNAEQKPVSLFYKGTEYPLKKHMKLVLLIGTDSVEAYEEEQKLQDYYNYNQADFLMLLAFQEDTDTVEILQLNRDTMTEVPWLDVLGNYGGTEFKQLCLAFNYGDGGMKSCKNTVDAVSDLLFDLPIDSYIQLPMSAIGLLNDLVGGVPVRIEEDLTRIDPAFVEGKTVKLTGAQAERFVRARMFLEDDTNTARMRRHRTYLDSFQICAKNALDADSEFAMRFVEKLSEHLQSNLTAQQLSQLVEKLDASLIAPIVYPDGELIRGERYYEFYVNEDSLWELVRSICCQ